MKLNIIKASDVAPDKEGTIWIDNTGTSPVLRISGNTDPINSRGTDHFTKISDLDHRLKLMDWGITERLFIKNSTLCLHTGTEPLDYSVSLEELSEEDKFTQIEEVVDSEEIKQFEKLYGLLMNTKPYQLTINNKSANLSEEYYFSLISLRDLVNNSSTVNVISNGDSKYTSVINLCNYVPKDYMSSGSDSIYKYIDCSGMADIEVRYTKNEKIYSCSKKVEIFNVIDSDLDFLQYQDTVGGDITIEVSSGCIRLFPMSQNVTECIISKCYLTINE